MTDAWRRLEVRKEREAKEKARQEAEAKRESMARQNRYIGVLDKFIHEGHEALSSFAKTDRVNFNEKESASIYYGIMASAVKHNIGLDSKASIESAAKGSYLICLGMVLQTSSRNVSLIGQNSSPRMKFNSQTTPLTTSLLLLTTCHAVQTHTFHLVALMVVPTNLQIGTEHKRQDWELLHG